MLRCACAPAPEVVFLFARGDAAWITKGAVLRLSMAA